MVKVLLAFMVALVGLAAAVGVTSADFSLKDWRYFKPLAVPLEAGSRWTG